MRESKDSDTFHFIGDQYHTIHVARDSNGSPTQSLFKQHLTKNVDLVKSESSYTILVFQLSDSILGSLPHIHGTQCTLIQPIIYCLLHI